MNTLLQNIDKLIENSMVTDSQEDKIDASFDNLKTNLMKDDSNLSVKEVFLNGSSVLQGQDKRLKKSPHLASLIHFSKGGSRRLSLCSPAGRSG
ncbi:MAG: hypothetical protein LBC68_00625 [Prevotellaceae bacterium]|jgi:hypothetical protein|nr:hypothetical protein [Prevotellaceae bacterium]